MSQSKNFQSTVPDPPIQLMLITCSWYLSTIHGDMCPSMCLFSLCNENFKLEFALWYSLMVSVKFVISTSIIFPSLLFIWKPVCVAQTLLFFVFCTFYIICYVLKLIPTKLGRESVFWYDLMQVTHKRFVRYTNERILVLSIKFGSLGLWSSQTPEFWSLHCPCLHTSLYIFKITNPRGKLPVGQIFNWSVMNIVFVFASTHACKSDYVRLNARLSPYTLISQPYVNIYCPKRSVVSCLRHTYSLTKQYSSTLLLKYLIYLLLSSG